MKTCVRLLFMLAVCSLSARAQISNLTVNGVTSNFSFQSGDAVSWTYNLPTGGTATGEIWYDVNQNGVIDPTVDVLRFYFTQTDGSFGGNGGPPDLDGTVNGQIYFSTPIGVAPGKYVVKFTNGGVSQQVAGTVTPLTTVAHSISGHVTPPAGKSPQYVCVEIKRHHGSPDSWDAYTDASGNYSIQMNADTAGNPWEIRMRDGYNPFPPAICSPPSISVTVTGNLNGNNFVFLAAAAQVAGVVKDDAGNLLSNIDINLQRNDSLYYSVQGKSDVNGMYQLGLQSADLNGNTWNIWAAASGSNNGTTTTTLAAVTTQFTITSGDSLYRPLTIYNVNSQIKGKVQLDGHSPGFPILVLGSVIDTAQSSEYSDSATGSFVLPVSDKLPLYTLGVATYGGGWTSKTVYAHAGDSNVVLNLYTAANVFAQIYGGWNMVSVPVIASNWNKPAIYPSAISSAFSYSSVGGYSAQSTLNYGTGYWVKFPGSNSQFYTGRYLSVDTINVAAGWNLIGSVSDSVHTSSIVKIGTSTSSQYFGYGGGYNATTVLNAGSAYWIKVSSAGKLVLIAGSAMPPGANIPSPEKDQLQSCGQVIVRDATGSGQTLLLSGKPGIDLAKYELPPLPPAGIADVRFGSGRYVEGPEGASGKYLPLQLSGVMYPVTIRWNGIDAAASPRLIVDGKEVAMGGSGGITLQSAPSTIGVSVAGGIRTPVKFSLGQNYPNPFNPSTNVEFGTEDPGLVTLKVYDFLGREVASLINENLQPGVHHATWDASQQPSGVYYYRLRSGARSEVRAMILMK